MHELSEILYGKLVASRLDRAMEHIERHELSVTLDEYIEIADRMLMTWFTWGGTERDQYIFSDAKYVAVIGGRTEYGHWIVRSIRKKGSHEENDNSYVPQEIHPYRSAHSLKYSEEDIIKRCINGHRNAHATH